MSDAAFTREGSPPIAGRLAPLQRQARWATGEAATALRAVYVGVAAYAAVFIFATVIHYLAFEDGRADLGNMAQAVWNTLHGHFLATTTAGQERIRLGGHVDPFLALFAPLFWLWSSPVVLLVVQVLAVASGALPVFWLARKHLSSSRAGAHFAFAYLLYPATQYNAFTPSVGFHSVSMAVPLVLYAVWFLDEDRLVAFSAVALLACTTKEEIPLAVGCLGIWYAVRKGHRLFGFSVFAIGLGATLFNFLWLIPHYSATGVDPFAGRYGAVGGTPTGIAHKLVTDPRAFAHALATPHKAVYVGFLLAPLLGLWLFEPLLLLGALPDLAINLLSNVGVQTSPAFHYTAGIVPFVVVASIFGAARFKARGVTLSGLVLAAVALVAFVSPLYALRNDLSTIGSARTSAKDHAVSLIPNEVPVSASVQLGGYLSTRRVIYTFPFVGKSRWIIADINDPTARSRQSSTSQLVRVLHEYEADRAWRIVFSSHGITVLHHRSARTKVARG